MIGGTVSSASRHLSHSLTLAVNVVILGAIFAFTLRQASRRRFVHGEGGVRGKAYQYGPTILVAVGSLCVLSDNLRHVLQDAGIWRPGPWPGSSQYRSDCAARWVSNTKRHCGASADCGAHDCGGGFFSASPGLDCYTCLLQGDFAYLCTANAETFSCLSAVGWVFTVVLTYAGFALLAVGSLWNAQLLTKLAAVRDK